MKCLFCLVATLWSVLPVPRIVQAAPILSATPTPAATPVPEVTAGTDETMPAEVTAMMAPGAVTVKFARLPLGAKGAPVLFHAWKIDRRSNQTISGTMPPTPTCLDLFYRSGETGEKWELASSVSYLSTSPPYRGALTYTIYWLRPGTNLGFVVLERTEESTGATCRLITLPEGAGNHPISEQPHPFVQEFYASYSGGQSIGITFGRDKVGNLIVEETIHPHAVAPVTHNTYSWNGKMWVQTISRRVKQR